MNDINVLDRSHLFKDLADGKGPKVNYSVNGNTYNMGYYLTDGIYPTFATFVKSFNDPKTAKEKVCLNITVFTFFVLIILPFISFFLKPKKQSERT